MLELWKAMSPPANALVTTDGFPSLALMMAGDPPLVGDATDYCLGCEVTCTGLEIPMELHS